MRLIDADALIQKESVMRKGCAYIEEINNAPTIDAELVVRCKECKHYIPSEEIPHRGWCDDALQNLFKEDFYCAFGERGEP